MKTTHIILSLAGVAVAGTAGYLLYKKYYGGGAPANPFQQGINTNNFVVPTEPLKKTLPSTEPLSNTLQRIFNNITPIVLPGVVSTPSPTAITKGTSSSFPSQFTYDGYNTELRGFDVAQLIL